LLAKGINQVSENIKIAQNLAFLQGSEPKILFKLFPKEVSSNQKC
jgi:Flp pilus assembly protein TadD